MKADSIDTLGVSSHIHWSPVGPDKGNIGLQQPSLVCPSQAVHPRGRGAEEEGGVVAQGAQGGEGGGGQGQGGEEGRQGGVHPQHVLLYTLAVTPSPQI